MASVGSSFWMESSDHQSGGGLLSIGSFGWQLRQYPCNGWLPWQHSCILKVVRTWMYGTHHKLHTQNWWNTKNSVAHCCEWQRSQSHITRALSVERPCCVRGTSVYYTQYTQAPSHLNFSYVLAQRGRHPTIPNGNCIHREEGLLRMPISSVTGTMLGQHRDLHQLG